MNFVDIKNDVAFRKIFGNSNKPEIIISFLNAVLNLPKGKKIKQITIENPFMLPAIKVLKSSILDVRVTDERDISYIVEMQVEESDGFDKRVQYYVAKKYSSQINVGEDYPKLNQEIFIGILDFNFFTDDDAYISRHKILNIKTKKSSLNEMEYNFIELKKFNKKIDEITTLSDKWIYFLKHAKNLDVIPSGVKDVGLKQAYIDASKHAWTKKELERYDYASMRKQDKIGVVTLAHKRGIKEGIKEEQKRSKKIIEQSAKKQQEAELKASIFKYFFIEKKEIPEIAKITNKSQEYVKAILNS